MFLEPWLRRLERHSWEGEWAIERARSPDLLAEQVPGQLEDAVTSGWIEPGSRAIDIGAGRGQVAAWLAARGFPVVATDISEEAVRLGRTNFAHLAPLLEFRTLDASLRRRISVPGSTSSSIAAATTSSRPHSCRATSRTSPPGPGPGPDSP
ncbi:MAG: class I SAM-dependent methyltransferase [Alphaproteobacteria bacterium]